MESETELVWNKRINGTETEKFMKVIEKKYCEKFASYWEFYHWTINNLDTFFDETWKYFQLISSHPYEKVSVKHGTGLLDYEWFPQVRFNYAENLLKIRDETPALIYVDEEDNTETVTFNELYEKVRLYTAAFRNHGLVKGDTVACYMSNRSEAVYAMLAVASVGGIWGGPHCIQGLQKALDVIQHMDAKFLISEDCHQYGGQEYDILSKLHVIANSVSSLRKIIILKSNKKKEAKNISSIKNSCFLEEFLEKAKLPDGQIPDLKFDQYTARDPLFITYTSGTTGEPKGLVHSGQVIIPQLIEMAFHFNLKKSDVLMNHISVGYSEWNMFMSALALGVTVFNYAGDICYIRPDGRNCWDIAAKHNVTYAFTVTSCIDKMQKTQIVPSKKCNMDKLEILAIGGSPLKSQNYKFAKECIKKDIFVGNYYGSSESFGLFGGMDLNIPVYAREVQVPALGKKVECYNSEGRSVIGEIGELVITNPSPSFPLYAWKDKDGSKMKRNYFDKFSGVWCVNDECWINPLTKGIVIIGRSDDVINVNDALIVPECMYQAIHDLDEIQDYICVSYKTSNGDTITVLFVQPRKGIELTSSLRHKISITIAKNLSLIYVPQLILETKDIPYSQYGKRMESVVRKILVTNEIPKTNNIRNPECLAYFCNRPEIMI